MSIILNWMSKCVLKYMSAAELFSFSPVVGLCLLLKVSLTQFLRRKQEVRCVTVSCLHFLSLSYFGLFYHFIKEKIDRQGLGGLGCISQDIYRSTLYINNIPHFWPMGWCSYFVSKSELDFLQVSRAIARKEKEKSVKAGVSMVAFLVSGINTV